MQADELLRNGDIAGARAFLADELRRAPTNTKARQFFWQLIALVGEWEKAENQLRTLATTQPAAMMLATVYSQAMAAERKRHDVMTGAAKPASLVGTEPWVEGLLEAFDAANRADPDAAAKQASALEAAPTTEGSLNGDKFGWISDADQRFGPMLEVIVGDDYGFIPFAAMAKLTSTAPEDLRDSIWLPIEITLKSGQASMAFTPVTYPATRACGDAGCVLGRVTDWIDRGGLEIGLGQHLLVTDTVECGILDLRELTLG